MQEIIVYRNPMEAAMWQALMSGEFFPAVIGVVVFFAVFLSLHSLLVKRYGSWGKRAVMRTNVALGVGILCGVLTIWKMWI